MRYKRLDRYTAQLPSTFVTPEMRSVVERYARINHLTLSDVQRQALELFFNRDLSQTKQAIDTKGQTAMTTEQVAMMESIMTEILARVDHLETRVNALNAELFMLHKELNPRFVLTDQARAALNAESTIFTPGPDWATEVRASLFPDDEDQDGAA